MARAALRPALGEARHQRARPGDRVAVLARTPLRAGPAIMDEIEDDAVDVVKLHLVGGIVAIVRLAHDPFAAGFFDALLRRLDIIDPDAEVMQADEVLAHALRRPIALEGEERHVHQAIGQKDALGETRIGFSDHLEAENVLVELGRHPGIRHRHGNMAKLSHVRFPMR